VWNVPDIGEGQGCPGLWSWSQSHGSSGPASDINGIGPGRCQWKIRGRAYTETEHSFRIEV
jgi:hypothetical protein